MRFSTLAAAVLAFASLAPAASAQGLTRADGSTGFRSFPEVKITDLPASSNFVPTTITQNTSQTINTGASGVGVACPTAPTSVYRRFDLSAFPLPTGIAVTSVGFGIESVTAGPSTLNIYRLTGAFTLANLTLVGTAAVPLTTADNGTIRNVPITGTFGASDVLVVEWVQPRANLFFGGNSAGQSGLTYLQATGCGAAEPTDLAVLAAQFATSHWVVNVTGETTPAAGPALSASPTSIAFGTTTPVGTTAAARTVTLTNSGTAATTITSITGSGAPFIVSTTGTALTLAPGATTTFTVAFAPTTGTAATGTVRIVSNAPNSPLVINLTGTGLPPPPAGTYPSADTPLPIPDNTPAGITSTIVVPTSVTSTIADLNVSLNITHTWVGDVIATLSKGTLTSSLVDRPGVPAPSTVGCSSNNIVIIVDDQGTDGAVETTCGASSAVDAYTTGGRYTPNSPLSAFNATVTAGTYTLQVSDNAGGDTGTLNSWALLVTAAGTAGEGSADALASRLAVAPNPMRGTSQIDLTVGTAQDVRVAMYDALGREVAVLLDRAMTAGQQAFVAVNTTSLPAGVYVVRATGTDLNLTQRVTVVR